MEEEIDDVWDEMGYLAMATRLPAPRDIDDWCEFFSPKLWFYDQQGRVKPEKVKAVIRYATQELGVTQFVVDSLMMIGVSREDYESQAQFIADLKTLASDTGCTIHLVAHMRKTDNLTGEGKPGGMHDISGGHEISSIADSIFQVWRDKGGKGEWPAVLKVEKQRGSVNWIGSLGLGYDNNSRQYTNEKGGRPKQYCGVNAPPL
jgi:twinkle protein